jgi:energy-coupling factor transporter transmembrane protein EcfT
VALHPATKILLFVVFAAMLQWQHHAALTALTAALIALLAYWRVREFAVLLRRARFLLLSLLTIYAFATPGGNLVPAWGAMSPTLEGVQSGALQAWRLAVLLAALALLLGTTPRERLLAGLYVLLRPFRFFGVDAERIAVRLWLTLHYAEGAPRRKGAAWLPSLQQALEPGSAAASVVILEGARLGWIDGLALLASLGLVVGMVA